MNDTCKAILHLSLIPQVGPATIKKLITFFKKDSISLVYKASVNSFVQAGISYSLAGDIYNGLKDFSKSEREIELAVKNNIKIITILDKDYPKILSEIYLPPSVLYVKGDTIWNQYDTISFVGSRLANSYGQRVINLIVPQCVKNGFCVASGGAIGVDSMAHKKALDSGGKTIVVLGSGLLNPYPYVNKKLFDSAVAHGGCVLSSFPLEAKAKPGNFPARNRIISGLSLGCVVVQAAEKSGALITAYFALEQGREVFAVPGHVDDALSCGCHNLIKNGAKLTSNFDDILQEINHLKTFKNKLCQNNIIDEHNNEEKYSIFENEILSFCIKPQSITDIAKELKKQEEELYSVLCELQIKNAIQQDFCGKWSLC